MLGPQGTRAFSSSPACAPQQRPPCTSRVKLISPAELPFLSVRGMRRLCPLVMCDSGYCRQRKAFDKAMTMHGTMSCARRLSRGRQSTVLTLASHCSMAGSTGHHARGVNARACGMHMVAHGGTPGIIGCSRGI